ncbi:ketol-acid reductoisomerase [Parvularcula lutaonensis]|uniref:Ketol-acid reductoisomerase (NADP(+)) n=1 Tax=Parvularcula lutaonensis TaxID=491923 RepID=A0ABV7M7R7_9PROT|nr:ketol-acid reductoisomerase [Parvularcula lutaonensis]GGY56407.1 ketol-acid reductoisomerase (NADP(+)) [Parvularcula lutaonensis]
MTDRLRVFTKDDVDPDALKDKTIAVIGYGAQGRAQGLNLRDSGLEVIVGARAGGGSEQRARADGFHTLSVEDAAEEADVIAMLAPDMAHGEIYEQVLRPRMKEGDTLLFGHGFSVLYGLVKPAADIDVVMVAPKGIGQLVRREYEKGRGVPALFSIHQDATGNATKTALGYADGIGGTAAAIWETTFRDEAETDMFGEQAVLCGGVTELFLRAYETLVEAGYPRELAYTECFHELKLVVDILHEGGLNKMYSSISETAAFGDLLNGGSIIGPEVKERMKGVLDQIRSGQFAHEWILENQAGKARFEAMKARKRDHDIEDIGQHVRSFMPWLEGGGNNSGD